MMRRAIAALFPAILLVLFLASPAASQVTASFSPTGSTTLSVSITSSRVAFATPGPTAFITNTGANIAYLNFGGSAVAATTGGYILGAGCSIAYNVNGQGYVAGITSASTTTLTIITGAGIPTLPQTLCANPIGDTVTANQGTPNAGGTQAWPVATSPSARTIVALDVATVTTGGTAVTALIAGHRTAGGFLYNPIGATVNLCINEQGVASGTTSAGALTCVQPGQAYTLTPSAAAVSVVTSDSSHPFSGQGLN